MNYSKTYIPPTNETATPKFVNINIVNFTAEDSSHGWYLDGLPESPVNNTIFSGITLTNTKKLVEQCDNTVGFCDNSTVSPYCPSCIQAEPCVDMTNDCSQYLTQCSSPKYRE
uniref:Uncharacterized protein n=1 Tax=Acrobeloides nanus TaxID=290746 RepID=A0A914DV51_9BILA